MAPPLAEGPDASGSTGLSSSPLMRGLGSLGPVLLMILLLLLCFPFKRKRPLLSTLQRELNPSELIGMTSVEGGLNPHRKVPPDAKLYKGSPLPSRPAESQMNGSTAEVQRGDAHSQTDLHVVTLGHQSLDHPGGHLGPPASCPPSASPNSLQLRKLPLTPKEAHLSRMEPLNQSADNRVYESIRKRELELRPEGVGGGSEGSSLATDATSTSEGMTVQGLCAGAADRSTAGAGSRLSQAAVPLECKELHGRQPDVGTPERDAALPVPSDVEKRLSMMYARVCKKPRPPQPLPQQPASPDKPADPQEEEEEPPPIPEKHFEDFYESLSFDTEAGEMLGIGVTPEV